MSENRPQLNPSDIAFNAYQNGNDIVENGIARLPQEVALPNGENSDVLSNKTPIKTINAYSNRLSGKVKPNGTPGSFIVEKGGAGGLAAALKMALVLEEGYGEPVWVGWPGYIKDYEYNDPEHINQEAEGLAEALRTIAEDEDYKMSAIHLTPEEYERYYLNWNNDRYWMVAHGFPLKSEFDWKNPPEYDADWETNKQVNRKFAEHAVQNYKEGDRFWIHDYHLMLQAKYMREMMPEKDFVSSFFMHIPFPKPEDFSLFTQEQQSELLEGLLSNTSVFFHTPEDVSNFMENIKNVYGMDAFTMEEDQNGNIKVGFNNRSILVGAKPIGIDSESFETKAYQLQADIDVEKAEFLRKANGRKISYSVARLDPSKGSPERILAVEQAQDIDPHLQETGIYHVEVVAPSRKGVKAYDELDRENHVLTEQVNKRSKKKYGWDTTIDLYDQGIHNFTELAALMGIADIALITPIKDGYNLVEDENATLKKQQSVAVYGKGAGASRAYENMAVLVDGSSMWSVTHGLIRAVRMLRQNPEIVRDWNTKMKQHVHEHTVRTWAQSIRRDGNL